MGLIYSTSAQAALSALGTRTDVGDWKAEGDTVISYINAHGGMSGRRLMPVWYNAHAQDDPNTVAEAACQFWTQDHHVDAAVPDGTLADMSTMRTCLAKVSTPAISVDWHVQTLRQAFATSPLWMEPSSFSLESYARTYVDNLDSQGFFDGGKLGIVYDDGPDFGTVERAVLEPELRRHHVDVVARASYEMRGFSDVGGAEPAVNAAVLKFKTAGVDRVMDFETWVGWAFFMKSAQEQGYYPTYGLSSQTAWEVAYATGLIPDDELTNAYYVGWSPTLDLPADHVRSWPRLRLCHAIYDARGVRRSGQIADIMGLSICDGLLDLTESRDLAGWQSAFMPSIDVTAARPYGVKYVRPGRWHSECNCFAYTGPPVPITS